MKKTIAFVLALVMLLSLTACSGNTTQSPAEGTQPSSAPVEKTETGESGKDEFVIGMYNVMSGANAIYGEEAQNALKMVVDKMNAEGGINGATVRYVVYDDQGSPEEAVKVVTKLIEVDKVDACITSCISSAVLATGEALNKAEIVSFGTGLSPTYMAQGWEYLFRACVNSDYTTPKAVELAKDLGVSSVAVFRGQDESAIATAQSFIASCGEQNIEVLTEEAYNDGDSDFSGQITRIIASNPDAVFMSTVGATYGVFIKQLRQYGYDGLILNKEALPTDAVEVAGVDNADYVAFAAPYLTYSSLDACTDPTMLAFLTEYQSLYGTLPATDSAYRVYDSLLVLWEAAKNAGTNDHAAIRDAVNQVTGLQGLGGILDYSAGNREGLSDFNKFIRIDGKNVLVSEWLAAGNGLK